MSRSNAVCKYLRDANSTSRGRPNNRHWTQERFCALIDRIPCVDVMDKRLRSSCKTTTKKLPVGHSFYKLKLASDQCPQRFHPVRICEDTNPRWRDQFQTTSGKRKNGKMRFRWLSFPCSCATLPLRKLSAHFPFLHSRSRCVSAEEDEFRVSHVNVIQRENENILVFAAVSRAGMRHISKVI